MLDFIGTVRTVVPNTRSFDRSRARRLLALMFIRTMFQSICSPYTSLQGFTSGEANGAPGNDFDMGEISLADNTSWMAGWMEGNFEPDEVNTRSTKWETHDNQHTADQRICRF